MSEKKIIILGAGLAGLAAAWHLQKRQVPCLILEKEAEPGGLCRSKNIGGFILDYDGHLLHFRHRYSFELVKELLKDNLIRHSRSSWIYSSGRYTRYPFQANLYGLPAGIIKECLMGFIRAPRNGHKTEYRTFLDWINRNFGSGIAKHFMIPYNTKFWTVKPAAMTCSWLDGFIPVPSLNQVVEGTVDENKEAFGYNAHFWYPRKGGINRLVSAFVSRIEGIRTNSGVTSIDLKSKRVVLQTGEELRYDLLVTTLPLPELAGLIKDAPPQILRLARKLRWNSIFNLNIGLDKRDYLGRHWVYFPEKGISFFRVGFFHNFSPNLTPEHKSSIYVEVSYSRHKPIDRHRIVSRIMNDLKKVNIISSGDGVIFQDSNDIKYGYPIYDRNYSPARSGILEYLSANGVSCLGRYGSWKYMSMEDVILDGKSVADSLLLKL